MRVVGADAEAPSASVLDEGVRILEAGRVVGLPTETFYGLAADAFDATALCAVNRLKGKPGDAPVLLLLAGEAQLALVARDLPPSFPALARRFWPGPLTLVLHASPTLPGAVGGGRGTVAVRVPRLGLPRRLADRLGRPISGVSANRHGEPPPTNADQVRAAFPEGLDLLLDAGPTAGTAPSTILDLTGERPRLVRVGAVDAAALAECLGITPRGLSIMRPSTKPD